MINCQICLNPIEGVAFDGVTIYTKPVCIECAKRHGIKCSWCGEWGLKGDDDFPSGMYGQADIHRKCMDHQDAFNKRRTR